MFGKKVKAVLPRGNFFPLRSQLSRYLPGLSEDFSNYSSPRGWLRIPLCFTQTLSAFPAKNPKAYAAIFNPHHCETGKLGCLLY